MMSMSRGSTAVSCPVPPESRRSFLELAVAPSAVRLARHWTADHLAEADQPYSQDLVDTAVLLVSELVTNAIAAVAVAATGPGIFLPGAASARIPAPRITLPLGTVLPGTLSPGQGRVWLVITCTRENVLIEVHDSACMPLAPACHRDADDETGRGLTVVTTLATTWGWRPDGLGKLVWCELSV